MSDQVTSPSKSIRSFFKNRHSAYSIDSFDDRRNLAFRPHFSRSRLSFQTISSTASTTLAATVRKPTLEDFADSSSSSADDDSVESILENYKGSTKTLDPVPQRPDSRFVFKEIFDENVSLAKDSEPSSKRSLANSNPSFTIRRNPSQRENRSIIEMTLAHTSLASSPRNRSSGDSSIRFKIYDDTEKKLVDRRTMISVNSNPDNIPGNRSSLHITSPARKEDKYPDPDVTPLPTPQKPIVSPDAISSDDSTSMSVSIDPNTSERPLRPLRMLVRYSLNDETVLNEPRESFRTSLSLGELLTKLDDFYDEKKDDTKFGNLTAGLDSSNDLPVMLYTVHDKNEKNQRWLVYEKEKKQLGEYSPYIGAPAPVYHSSPSSSVGSESTGRSTGESARAYIERNFNERIGDFRRDRPRGGESTFGRSPSVYHKTSDISLHKPSLPLVQQHKEIDFEQMLYPSSIESGLLYYTQIPEFHDHLWSKFVSMMVVGLVAPPIFFLLSFGAFDSNAYNRQTYYVGTEKTGVKKKYTHFQKLASLFIGLFWVLVVLAMIGVGLGLVL